MTKERLLMTWRRQPGEKGLASIGQSERGWDLRIAGEDVAAVRPRVRGFRETEGWYFYGRDDARDVPLENTANAPVGTPEEAMSAAEAHFAAHLNTRYALSFRRPRGMGSP